MANPLSSMRDLGRLTEIAGVLIKHGLGDLVRRFGLADALEKAGHQLRWDRAADLAKCPRQRNCAVHSKSWAPPS